MIIKKYNSFITESKLNIILESKMSYGVNFIDIVSKLKSPIAKHIINLQGKDVDVNTNYIEVYPGDKDSDVITFIPDNKVDLKIHNPLDSAVVIEPGNVYCSHHRLFKYAGLDISDTDSPEKNEKVKIVRIFTPEEIRREFGQNVTDPIVWVKSLSNGNDYFMGISGIKRTPSSIKGNDIKVGRFAKKLLTKAGIKVSDKEIEEFVNQFKAKIEIINNVFARFKIVQGEDIRKYYLEDNYAKLSGTLGSSCMRYSQCQKYLEIYTSNPDKVNLIVMMDPDEEDKISGRALLWTYGENRKFMDRVYTSNSADESLFVEFAIKNKFRYKETQSNDENMTVMFNGEEDEDDPSIIEVFITNGDYEYYPYMDTLKYYNAYRGKITNSDESYDYKLEDTDGGNGSCSTCGGSGVETCDDCRGNGEVDCSDCDGSGEIECGNCDGSGEVPCRNCDGEGEVDCEYCDGSGEDKDGTKCGNCDGNGKVECNVCDGSCDVKCEDCSGRGNEECGNCDGSGQVECYNCGGNGETSCNECG